MDEQQEMPAITTEKDDKIAQEAKIPPAQKKDAEDTPEITPSDDDDENDFEVSDSKPIQNGEPFDPSLELKRIRQLSKQDRAQAIGDFKDKLTYQHEGYAFLRDALIEELKQNTTVTPKDLQAIAERYRHQYGFPESSVDILNRCIDYTFLRKNRVEQIRNDIPDDSLLCKQMFGFVPEGDITITTGPVTFNVQFHNATDFSKAYHHGGRVTDEKLKESSEKVGGFFLKQSGINPRWNGIIIALNGYDTNSPTYAHEEQHALHDILSPFIQTPLNRSEVLYLAEGNLTEEETKKILTVFFTNQRSDALLNVKDEILAYKKANNFSDETMIKLLTEKKEDGGLYDYTHDTRKEMTDAYQSIYSQQTKNLVQEVMDETLITEYRELVKKAVEAFNFFQGLGYEHDEVISLLSPIPIEKWQRFAKDIAETGGEKLNYTVDDLLEKYEKRYKKRRPEIENADEEDDNEALDKNRQSQVDAIRRTLEIYGENG